MFDEIKFANPEFFWLFIIIPIIIVWHILKSKKLENNLSFSQDIKDYFLKNTLKIKLLQLPFILRILSLSLIIVVLARPQTSSSKKSINSDGIDIMLAMDISGSMLAQDFKPNRLEAAKEKAIEFIDERENDRIGLAIFAGEAFTQSPITVDHKILKSLIQSLEMGRIKDGTAIGDGLATAVNRLKESKSKSKIIILLTDGVSNTGFIAPETASELAKSFNIKVYTIGVGTIGKAPYPVDTPFGRQTQMVDVEIDEVVLKNISKLTGGEYFRATNNKSLSEIYKKIDKLEKTKIEVAYFNNFSEEFLLFGLIALALLTLEYILRFTFLRTL